MAGDTERSPLLGQRSHSPSTSTRLGDAVHGLSREARGQNIIILMLCAVLFFASWANGFTQIPLLRLVEDRICHEYYDMSMSPLEPIDEKLCKGEWIQSRLAFILSISSAIGALAGFLAAFPWGAAADRIGRKPILTLALTGMALEVVWDIAVVWFHNMPIKLIWLGGVLNIVGGGNAIIIGMIFSIATDATTDEERAVAFLRLHVAGMAGSLVSPTLCALVMERASPWICQWIGVSLLIFGSVAIYAVPNPPKPSHSPSHDEQESDSDDEDPVNRKRVSKLLKMISLPITPSLFIFFLLTFLSIPVALATQMFMSQYASKRYHIKLASTGYIQSTFGVGHIIQAFVILPFVSHLLTSATIPAIFRVKDEKVRDVVLLRGSFFFLIVGLIVVGLATDLIGFMFGLVVLVLGSGYASLLKSLMSLYADAKHRSRLFSLIGMVEVLARVYSEPALAGLYSLGLRHGGGWIGIPYFGVALFIAVCLALLSFVKLPKSNEAVAN